MLIRYELSIPSDNKSKIVRSDKHSSIFVFNPYFNIRTAINYAIRPVGLITMSFNS